jgi:hypothetical protein
VNLMSMIDKTLEGILRTPSEARKVQEALVSGRVAHVIAPDRKEYLVFTGEAAAQVKKKIK